MAVGLPMIEKSGIRSTRVGRCALARPVDRSSRVCTFLSRNGGANRFVHLVVSGAAAKIAAQRVTDVGLRRIGIFREQRFYGHDESGRAVSALRAAPVAVCFLNRSET